MTQLGGYSYTFTSAVPLIPLVSVPVQFFFFFWPLSQAVPDPVPMRVRPPSPWRSDWAPATPNLARSQLVQLPHPVQYPSPFGRGGQGQAGHWREVWPRGSDLSGHCDFGKSTFFFSKSRNLHTIERCDSHPSPMCGGPKVRSKRLRVLFVQWEASTRDIRVQSRANW